MSKSLHILQHRVELHDQYYHTGYADLGKVQRLAALANDLLTANTGLMRMLWPDMLTMDQAVEGIVTLIRILNISKVNARQAFMIDGIAEASDVPAIVIESRALSKAINGLTSGATLTHLKVVNFIALGILSIYVRQYWKYDHDLGKAIQRHLEAQTGPDLIHACHAAEIERQLGAALVVEPRTPSSNDEGFLPVPLSAT